MAVDERVWDLKDCADYLRVTTVSLSAKLRSGEWNIPHFRTSNREGGKGRYRFNPKQVVAWCEEQGGKKP